MKLYYSPAACSLAPHIIAREAAIPLALEKVDTSRHLTADGADFYRINPKGQVPVLQLEDGSQLTEGPVIAQYLADFARAGSLLPAPGTLARYRVMEWQNYITSELHKSFTPLFNPALDVHTKTLLAGLLRKKLEWVDSQLRGRLYLTGESFTVADAYLFVVLGWSKFVQLEISDLAELRSFMARVSGRPAVREAMKAEALIS